jgi:hypothetical protein
VRTFFIREGFFIHLFILVCYLIARKTAFDVILVDILTRYRVIIDIRPTWSCSLLILATTSYVHCMSFQVALKDTVFYKKYFLL